MAENSQTPQTSESGSPTRAFLSIISGKSQFKERPLTAPRFLIGAGNTCHLQLGGQGIPLVHSIIEQEQGELRINSLVSSPALMVNGRPVRSCRLTDGDLLTIGVYRFQLHQEISVANATYSISHTIPFRSQSEVALKDAAHEQLNEQLTHESPDADDDDIDLEQLTASELVDLIEQEMMFVQQQEEAQREAARNLFQAVVQRAEQNQAEPTLEASEESEILQTLAELSENLEDCQSQLNATPGQDESRIRSLLSTQEQLLSRLEEAIAWLRDSRDEQQKQSA